jgi:broad specificity phosphatase PhoE
LSEPVPPLYFVRHGETEWNRQGIIQGWTDVPLSEAGHLQARAVAQALKADLVDTATYEFLVSPMLRTQQTMAHISKALNIGEGRITTEPLLKELGFGIWEGRPFWELKASPVYPADPETRYAWRPEGGESYLDGTSRLHGLLSRITRPTVMVSHGALGRCLIGLATGLGIRDLMAIRMLQGAYCKIVDGNAVWFDASKAPA